MKLNIILYAKFPILTPTNVGVGAAFTGSVVAIFQYLNSEKSLDIQIKTYEHQVAESKYQVKLEYAIKENNVLKNHILYIKENNKKLFDLYNKYEESKSPTDEKEFLSQLKLILFEDKSDTNYLGNNESNVLHNYNKFINDLKNPVSNTLEIDNDHTTVSNTPHIGSNNSEYNYHIENSISDIYKSDI